MIRKLMTATAISLIASSGALAAGTQDATTVKPTADIYMQAPDHSEMASKMIGETVYTSDSQEEAVGDINDLIVGDDGTIHAAVIGVGGFLGVGEKNVAVKFDSLHWVAGKDGAQFPVFEASREDLQNAPEFKPQETATAPAMPSTPDGTAIQNDKVAMAPAEPMGDQTAATTDQSGAAAMMDVQAASLSANDLIGATVYGANDENVGEVGDVRLTSDGEVDALIVDVGGFLGLGEKPVAIGFDSLNFKKGNDGTLYVFTALSSDQLDAAPSYDEASYDDQRDTMRLTIR